MQLLLILIYATVVKAQMSCTLSIFILLAIPHHDKMLHTVLDIWKVLTLLVESAASDNFMSVTQFSLVRFRWQSMLIKLLHYVILQCICTVSSITQSCVHFCPEETPSSSPSSVLSDWSPRMSYYIKSLIWSICRQCLRSVQYCYLYFLPNTTISTFCILHL